MDGESNTVTVTLTVIERVIKVMKVTGSVKARERQ